MALTVSYAWSAGMFQAVKGWFGRTGSAILGAEGITFIYSTAP